MQPLQQVPPVRLAGEVVAEPRRAEPVALPQHMTSILDRGRPVVDVGRDAVVVVEDGQGLVPDLLAGFEQGWLVRVPVRGCDFDVVRADEAVEVDAVLQLAGEVHEGRRGG